MATQVTIGSLSKTDIDMIELLLANNIYPIAVGITEERSGATFERYAYMVDDKGTWLGCTLTEEEKEERERKAQPSINVMLPEHLMPKEADKHNQQTTS